MTKNTKKKKPLEWHIVEKKNHNALHGIFDSPDRAINHLENIIPEYVRKGFFMDKTLTKNDFEIIENQ